MKVIDLLNKMVNKEELPNKFKFDGFMYDKHSDFCYTCSETHKIFEENFILEDLTKEIEIIEENKKIKHIEKYADFVNLNDSEKFDYLYEMETRIIDKINSMEVK